MSNDAELLRLFVAERSESAFRELVTRHLPFVYAVAARRLGADRHLADDVAQRVFVELARKASRLSNEVVLTGWLFTTTRFIVSRLHRAECRRRDRETKAAAMEVAEPTPESNDEKLLGPLVDEMIASLPAKDREVLLLRFFSELDFPQIGAVLELSADGARARVNRALEKLEATLSKRGIISTSSALAAALAAQPALAVPAGLAASVTQAAITTTTGGSISILAFFTMNKVLVGAAGIVAVASFLGLVRQRQTNSELRAEIGTLRTTASAYLSLRAENAQLVENTRTLADRLSQAQSERAELNRTREQLAGLQKQVAAMKSPSSNADTSAKADPRLIPTEAWINAGMDTPAASYQTAMWAHRQADVDTLARVITFTDEDRTKVAALFATLPESAREKYGSPEKLIALLFATGPDHAGFQVTSETVKDENTVVANVLVETGGRMDNAQLVFLRGAGGWRLLVPGNEVVSQIEKIKGESRPKS